MEIEKLDFLSEILAEGQELEINFSSRARTNFKITGTLVIKEQDLLVKTKKGIIRSPEVEAWMCTHPKHWKIVCGLEQADAKTNIKIMGMLVRAGFYELSQMMCRRIDVMISPDFSHSLEWLMPETPVFDDED